MNYSGLSTSATPALKMRADAPRVLFVTPVAFNPHSGGGATFASLFRGWPKEQLATIHNDPNPPSHDVCEKYFELGPNELDLAPPLNLVRRFAGARRRPPANAPANAPTSAAVLASSRSRWKDRTRDLRHLLFGDSLPERASLTPALARWIADYRPEVLYTILGSNGMMSLIEQIRSRFQLPLVVHIMDDWATAAHRKGIFAPNERRRLEQCLDHFFSVAHSTLGISPAMCEAYTQRYGRPFVPFQYALDLARWMPFTKRDLAPRVPPEFLYIGSIFSNAQLESLTECARAVADLNEEGFAARLRIISSADNCDRYRDRLQLHANIRMVPSFGDEQEFFATLSGADALLLPVNFDRASIDFIRYSMPTKIPAYLVSGTPVLVYGPLDVAQVRYALDSGWGDVTSERNPAVLKSALKRIIGDPALRQRLSTSAREAAKNHDDAIVRNSFQALLRQVVGP